MKIAGFILTFICFISCSSNKFPPEIQNKMQIKNDLSDVKGIEKKEGKDIITLGIRFTGNDSSFSMEMSDIVLETLNENHSVEKISLEEVLNNESVDEIKKYSAQKGCDYLITGEINLLQKPDNKDDTGKSVKVYQIKAAMKILDLSKNSIIKTITEDTLGSAYNEADALDKAKLFIKRKLVRGLAQAIWEE